jgi:hypothetical protein
MISVICVYNDKYILSKYLLKGLQDQTAEHELILVDNTKDMFSSAAEALNYGGNKARGRYLLFAHQDIDLSSKTWLEEAENILESLGDLGIAGVAGKSEGDPGIISNIKHGNPPKPVGRMVSHPERVQTLDECLMIIPRSVFDVAKFDGETCDGWHLYAVDYCLSLDSLGLNTYVLPMYVYHASAANSMSDSYFVTLGKVLKKHKTHCKVVHTTVGNWNTRYPIIINKLNNQIFLFKYYSKRAVREKVRQALKRRP